MRDRKRPTLIGWVALSLSALAIALLVLSAFTVVDDFGYHEGGADVLEAEIAATGITFLAAIIVDIVVVVRGRPNRIAGVIGGSLLLLSIFALAIEIIQSFLPIHWN